MSGQMSLADVLESALYVLELPAAEEFYTEILGLTLHSKLEGRHVFLKCGNRMILLFNAEATSVSAGGPNDGPTHGAKGEVHLAFAAPDREIDKWKQHLVENGVEIEKEIQLRGGRSIYFRDPSQNCLEIASPRIWGIPEETLSSRA